MADKLAQTLIDYIIDSRDSDSRKKYMTAASKYWELYRQENWWIPSEEADPYPADRPVSLENEMFPTIESLVSVFFKHLPVVEMRPYKPSDFDVLREQNKHIEYAMRQARFLEVFREGSRDCFITGQCIYNTGWDKSRLYTYGNGDCTFQAMPREDVFLDPAPGITDIQRSRFLALRVWLPYEVILEKFGSAAGRALGMVKGSSRLNNAMIVDSLTQNCWRG